MTAQLPAIEFREPYDTADISQFIRTLRRRARTVLLFTALAGAPLFCMRFLRHRNSPPRARSIWVKPNKAAPTRAMPTAPSISPPIPRRATWRLR